MRTLIQNYSSKISTECLYFHRCLLEVGEEASLWSDPSISTYDMFDSFSPDVFICHYEYMSTDIIKYLSSHRNISIIINVSGASDEVIAMIEKTISDAKINCLLMFTNVHPVLGNPKAGKCKLINILPGLDVFLPKLTTPLFKIGTAFISTKKTDLLDSQINGVENYHKLCIGDDSDYSDINLSIKDLVSVIDKYDKCVLVDDIFSVTSQLLYELTFRCNGSISIKVDSKHQSSLDKTLASLFYEQEDCKDFAHMIKDQIKRKHNCFNRTARLVKAIGNEDSSDKLRKVGENL